MVFKTDDLPILIVGLGNPEIQYEGTRHNIGFQIIDKVLNGMPKTGEVVHKFESFYWELNFRNKKYYFQKPLTYMNLSGKAVAKFAKKHDIEPKNILVIYDDLDLSLGQIRIRKQGGAGGHNGVKSLIDELGTEKFNRLRFGIGRPNSSEQVDFVLSKFAEDEIKSVEETVQRSFEAIKFSLVSGIEATMNKFNKNNNK